MTVDNEELDALISRLIAPQWHCESLRNEAADAIYVLRARVAELQEKYEACKLQAQCWSHEAKAQRSTVLESYQAASGASGEPGDWNGAEPIRRLVERAELAESQLQQVKADAERLDWIDENPWVEIECANHKAQRHNRQWFVDQGIHTNERTTCGTAGVRAAIDAARRNDGTA